MERTENRKIRVLLADDHSIVRAGIRKILEYAGDIEVVAEAEDGIAAQALIEQIRPDVAVLDIQMPRASGIEVTHWVREHAAKVGVLVLTAYDDDPYVTAVLQAGANGYVLKTSSPDDLIQAVREVNEGRSVLDPLVARRLNNSPNSTSKLVPYEALTRRERGVISLAAKGYTNKAIAVQLGISDRTVQGHLAHIYDKLQASSRTEAVMQALALGLITNDRPAAGEHEPF